MSHRGLFSNARAFSAARGALPAPKSLRMPLSSAIRTLPESNREGHSNIPDTPATPNATKYSNTGVGVPPTLSCSSFATIPDVKKLPHSEPGTTSCRTTARQALRSRPRYGRRTHKPTRFAKQMFHLLRPELHWDSQPPSLCSIVPSFIFGGNIRCFLSGLKSTTDLTSLYVNIFIEDDMSSRIVGS